MKDLLHNIEQDNLNGINASLISLLYGLHNYDENRQSFEISETRAAVFRRAFPPCVYQTRAAVSFQTPPLQLPVHCV